MTKAGSTPRAPGQGGRASVHRGSKRSPRCPAPAMAPGAHSQDRVQKPAQQLPLEAGVRQLPAQAPAPPAWCPGPG